MSINMTKNQDPKSRTRLQNVSFYFSQYCCATSIHGVQYLGERGRFGVEKMIWTIFVTGVCYFCIILIIESYYKWITSPVIVTFGTQETPIYDIPFPAVTICPEIKSNPSVFNYTDAALRLRNNETLTDDKLNYFGNMSLICDSWGTAHIFEYYNKYVNTNPLLTLCKIFPDPKTDSLFISSWMGNKMTSANFSLTYTEYGLCFSFNMLHYQEILNEPDEIHSNFSLQNTFINNWNLENGYSSAPLYDVYPRRTQLSGIYGGLLLEMFANDHYMDYFCGLYPQGFKVLLHFPSDWPNMDRYFHVSLDKYLLIAIKPRLITISEPLKAYRPIDRKCYLSNERKLKYFKIYSQENCLVECLTNFTLLSCGCFPFYMPYSHGGKFCDLGSVECIQTSEEKIYKYYKGHDNFSCNCLPSCTSIEYDIEISQSHWNWRKFKKTLLSKQPLSRLVDDELVSFSQMVIYFKERQFLNTERNELYSFLEFLANVGGLLGLFIGVSITSGLEILYFLTLRLICNIKRYGKKYWSGDERLIIGQSEKTID